MSPDSGNAEVGLLAPTGRDAALAVEVLAKWKLRVVAYDRIEALCDTAQQTTGVWLIATEALVPSVIDFLVDAVELQPPWSDIPIVVLTSPGESNQVLGAGIERLSQHANVTLLERPVRVATLVTVLRSAVRARARQWEVRGALVKLDEARRAAEEANRGKSEFLAMMSHELRTPLNAIGGYAELLELGVHGPVTKDQLNAIGRVQASSRHLLGLINGVLNFARLEAGKVQYERVPIPLDEVLSTSEALTAPQARAKHLMLDYGECDRTLCVSADREKVQQVLLNLLSNAVKFTDPGGKVSIKCAAAGESNVDITVADTGSGISKEAAERIFEPFVQVDARLTRTKEGVGLGLAISRDLARGMSGDLSVESSLGSGSVFTLTLPRAR